MDLEKKYCKFIIKKFGDIKDIKNLKKSKHIYKITLPNKIIRVDILDSYFWWIPLHNLAYENNVNVAKEIFCEKIDENFIRICDFIDGSFLQYTNDTQDVYYKSGIEMAKLNLVHPIQNKLPENFKNFDSNNVGLTNSDFSGPNAIYTNDKNIFMIDTNSFKIHIINNGNLDFTVVKCLLKWIKDKTKINYFLDGYSTLRNPDNIISKIKEMNWKWTI